MLLVRIIGLLLISISYNYLLAASGVADSGGAEGNYILECSDSGRDLSIFVYPADTSDGKGWLKVVAPEGLILGEEVSIVDLESNSFIWQQSLNDKEPAQIEVTGIETFVTLSKVAENLYKGSMVFKQRAIEFLVCNW